MQSAPGEATHQNMRPRKRSKTFRMYNFVEENVWPPRQSATLCDTLIDVTAYLQLIKVMESPAKCVLPQQMHVNDPKAAKKCTENQNGELNNLNVDIADHNL